MNLNLSSQSEKITHEIIFTWHPPHDPETDVELTIGYSVYKGSRDPEDPREIRVLKATTENGADIAIELIEEEALEAIAQWEHSNS